MNEFKKALWQVGCGEWPHSNFICPYFDKLKNLASQCDHITEFGTGWCASTIIFLSTNPKKIVSYDIKKRTEFDFLNNYLNENQIQFEFHLKDTSLVKIEKTDLLFIDSLHDYKHVKLELKNSFFTSKYIVLHDTKAFAHHNEKEKGIGIWPAIKEWWYSNYNTWDLVEKLDSNCGLTIFKRIKNQEFL